MKRNKDLDGDSFQKKKAGSCPNCYKTVYEFCQECRISLTSHKFIQSKQKDGFFPTTQHTNYKFTQDNTKASDDKQVEKDLIVDGSVLINQNTGDVDIDEDFEKVINQIKSKSVKNKSKELSSSFKQNLVPLDAFFSNELNKSNNESVKESTKEEKTPESIKTTHQTFKKETKDVYYQQPQYRGEDQMQMRKQRFETSYPNNFYLDNQPIIKNKRYNLNNNIPINNNSQFNNLPMNNMPVNSNNIPMNTGFNNFNNSYMPISNKKPNMHFMNINHPKNYKMMNFPNKMMMNRTMIPNLRPTREMEMNQKIMNVNNSQKRFNVNHYMMPQETFNPQFNPSFYGYNPKMDPRMIHKETANDPNQLKIKNSEFFQSPPLMHATKKTNCLTQMDIMIRDQKNKEKIAASSDRSRIKQSPHHKEKLKKRGRKPKNYENSLSGSNQGFQSIFKKKVDFDMTPEKWNALFDFKPVVITQPKLGDHIKARIINQKNKENKS